MLNANVECQCLTSMLNAIVECQCWMSTLNVNVECQCWMPMLNANDGVSYKSPAQNAQVGENDPKWVQNDRQVLRIGPYESYGGLPHSMFFLVFGWTVNGPALFGCSGERAEHFVACSIHFSSLFGEQCSRTLLATPCRQHGTRLIGCQYVICSYCSWARLPQQWEHR